MYGEIAALANDGTNRAISISDGSISNSVNLFYVGAIGDNTIRFIVFSNSSTQVQIDYTLSVTDNHKIAIKYKENDFALWVDGVEVGTDVNGISPIGLNNISFTQGGGQSPFYGKNKALAVFPILTDAQLQSLTTQ